MIQPGRNQPCPCGSGKKFKNCHARAMQVAASGPDLTWKRIRRALDGFPDMMLRFVRSVYGPDALHEGWEEFDVWRDGPGFDPDTPHMQVFMPWFFHHWAPDPHGTDITDATLHDRSPTAVLLERRGRRLDPLLRRYLEACVATPFSFHEVLHCQPGVGFRARDIFLGGEREVLERSASETMEVGGAFYGLLVTCDGVTLMEACGPLSIPPAEKISLIELRERISGGTAEVTAEMLADWNIELRDAYHELTEWLMDPPMPEMHNTEGHDLVFHTLTFEIGSAQEAFDALKHLANCDPPEEVEEAAQRDEEGRVEAAVFSWTDETTVLGHIEISGTRLVIQVNSAERAARFRAIMEGALGTKARHVDTEVQLLEEELAKRSEESEPEPPDELDLTDHPEVRQHLEEMMATHYEAWVAEKLPALGGLTPLEAVQDRAGREKVAALVDQLARDGRRMEPPLPEAIITKLRQRLGLA